MDREDKIANFHRLLSGVCVCVCVTVIKGHHISHHGFLFESFFSFLMI